MKEDRRAIEILTALLLDSEITHEDMLQVMLNDYKDDCFGTAEMIGYIQLIMDLGE